MKKLTQIEVQKIIEGTGAILFTTEGCSRCETVKQTLKDKEIGFFELSNNVYPQKQLNIIEAPTFIYFKYGNEVGRLKGINGLDAYINLINRSDEK